MFGRFVCVRVRVMTAAPLPGVSPPRAARGREARRASRPAADAAGSAGRATKKPTRQQRHPCPKRLKNGCGSPITFDLSVMDATRPSRSRRRRPPLHDESSANLGAVDREAPEARRDHRQDRQFAPRSRKSAADKKKGRR